MLRELSALPPGILDLPATQLHDALSGPTLIHLPGRREPALFVAVLMHGNETTGWDAVRSLLGGYLSDSGECPLPRALSLFISNTAAAAEGVRHLPGQPDYNRVWPGDDLTPGATPEHALMAQVISRMRNRGVFASVDLHNNTGLNPHYACVNVMQTSTLHLAALFGRTVVYFVRPTGVASIAMAELCPSVTLECGKPEQAAGVEHAVRYLDACLHLSELPQHELSPHDIDLYHTVATVKLPADIDFGFGRQGRDVDFVDDLEFLNFRELSPGTLFGYLGTERINPLDVRNESNLEVFGRYFSVSDGELRTRCELMPSMLTCDENVIKQDCLCYLMERYGDHLRDLARS